MRRKSLKINSAGLSNVANSRQLFQSPHLDSCELDRFCENNDPLINTWNYMIAKLDIQKSLTYW